MFVVKQVKRSQYASWDVVGKILITYGDADRQGEQLAKLKLEGWRVVKDANHKEQGLEIMNTVQQLVKDDHDDSLGKQPELDGLSRQEFLDAVESLTANATPETIVELGKALNNGVTLANKTPLKAKPKRGGDKLDFSALTSRFMAENPIGSEVCNGFMAAMAGGKLEDFLTTWAQSKVDSETATPPSGGQSFEELLAK